MLKIAIDSNDNHILKYEWILRKESTHYGLLNDDIRFVTHIK
jgi:hypothetical protein